MAEPGEEIEIATSKSTTMCLKYGWFQPERAHKAVAYKKKKVYFRTSKSGYDDQILPNLAKSKNDDQIHAVKRTYSQIQNSMQKPLVDT